VPSSFFAVYYTVLSFLKQYSFKNATKIALNVSDAFKVFTNPFKGLVIKIMIAMYKQT